MPSNTAIGSFFLALAILGAIFWLGVTGQAVTGSTPLLGMLTPAALVVLALGAAGLFFITRKRRR